MNLGISTFAYSWSIGIGESVPKNPMSAMDLLHVAKEFGVATVQFGDNLPLHQQPQDVLEQLKQFSFKEGIQIEVGARGLIPHHVKEYIDIAAFFNSPFLRIVIDAANYEPSVDEVISIVKDLLPLLKENNIKLAIENHDRFKSTEFVKVVEGTDPEWIGICLDTINSLGADQSIGEILPQLAPYTMNFHVKDYTIHRKWHNLGFDVYGTPAGQGMMPIAHILSELSKYGKCYSATLELWADPTDDIEATVAKEKQWAIESIKYLKTLIN